MPALFPGDCQGAQGASFNQGMRRRQGGNSAFTSCMVLLMFSLVLAIILVALVLQVIINSVNNFAGRFLCQL